MLTRCCRTYEANICSGSCELGTPAEHPHGSLTQVTFQTPVHCFSPTNVYLTATLRWRDFTAPRVPAALLARWLPSTCSILTRLHLQTAWPSNINNFFFSGLQCDTGQVAKYEGAEVRLQVASPNVSIFPSSIINYQSHFVSSELFPSQGRLCDRWPSSFSFPISVQRTHLLNTFGHYT